MGQISVIISRNPGSALSANQHAGLTQTELAERLKRPQSFVAKYENGERRVEVVEFVQIAEAIGCNPCPIIEIVAKADYPIES